MWPIINDVETGKTPEYPHVQPQSFVQPRHEVMDAAERVARRQPGWSVKDVNAGEGVIQAVKTTRLLRFKDDVTVRVSEGDNATVVNVRSKSRVGKGDLGQNARTILAFQRALSDELR